MPRMHGPATDNRTVDYPPFQFEKPKCHGPWQFQPNPQPLLSPAGGAPPCLSYGLLRVSAAAGCCSPI